MGEIHRFDKSKRARFRSDVLMPRIHAMMLRSLARQLRRGREPSRMTIILLAALAFAVVFAWPT